MQSSLIYQNKKFIETKSKDEDSLENIVKKNSKTIFGFNTVYFDLKNRVDTKFLGGTIPDGFLFDFTDKENPEFYLVEIELARHDFYRHIFPQITKFFAFYNNQGRLNELIEKLFSFIKSNPEIEKEFSQFVRERELYKTIKDILENSQKILIIIDDDLHEFEEMFETYTDTWGKSVRKEIVKTYSNNEQQIIQLNPDFEAIELIPDEPEDVDTDGPKPIFDEAFHLKNTDVKVVEIYQKIKNEMLSFDPAIKVNPQKYYISLKRKKAFAYIRFTKKKLRIVVMVPLEMGKQLINNHRITPLSEGVQNYYNGPCFKIEVENDQVLEEIVNILKRAYQNQ